MNIESLWRTNFGHFASLRRQILATRREMVAKLFSFQLIDI